MASEAERSVLPPHIEDNCLERIQGQMQHLKPSLRRVAQHVLANPWGTQGISIVDLARRAGVSQNTVSRFCVALGYSGFREFSTQLASTLGRLIGAAYSIPLDVVASTDLAGSASQVVNRIFALEMQCLHETIRQLDREAIERAVTALSSARAVLVVGMGATGPAASTAAYRLTLIGMAATYLSDPYLLVAQANTLRPGDVILGISYLGQSRTIIDALRIGRANGATAIALTTSPGSALARSADVCLTIASSVPMFANRQFSARVAGVLLVEALVSAVAWLRRNEASSTVVKSFELFHKYLEYDHADEE